MKQKVFKILILSLLVLTSKSFAEESARRIVSLLPSSTEILFSLNAEERLVGVTRYCRFPPEVREKVIVGGLLDPNFELIYSLNPDLIIIQDNEGEQTKMFKNMGIAVLEVETRSIEGIIESIRLIGDAVGEQEKALDMVNNIEKRIRQVQENAKDLPKPRVLITFLREIGEGRIKDVYVAGNHTFFHDFIAIAGGENAYQGSKTVTSPIITAEGILQINPDVIIEIMGDLEDKRIPVDTVLRDWDMLPELKAYKNKRIYVIPRSYAGIPGPRMIKTLEEIVRFVHPEVDWDAMKN